MNRIKLVQDYLCEIEEYLKKTLSNERLTPAAQIKRSYLLDRFYALDLGANDSRNPLGRTVSHSRPVVPPATSSTSITTTTTTATTTTMTTTLLKADEQFQKESVSQNTSEQSKDDEESFYNLYEEPVLYSHLDDDDDDSNIIPTSSIAQAEDCSDTEYESFEEGEEHFVVDANKSCDVGCHDNRQAADVPLPQAKKIPGNVLNLLSRLPNVHHSGHLYQKGLLSWLKRYCIISDSRLLAFRSLKHLRPLLVLDLIGCDVESVVRETSKYKHALKISRPTPGEGLTSLGPLSGSIHSSVTNSSSVGSDATSCWFYARDKETVDGWMLHLCLSGCLKSSNDKDSESLTADAVDTDSGVCALTSDNQTGISGGSSEGSSGDGVTAGTSGSDTKPSGGSSLAVSLSFKKKLKIGESLQSLIWGQFGKTRKDDKDDKIKKLFMEAGGSEAEVSHLAGYINVNSESVEGGPTRCGWTKKFCVARHGRLDCYKDPLDENVESTIDFGACVVADVDKQNKRICISCDNMQQSRERVEVNLEMFNPSDFNKWLVWICKETDRETPAEGLYNEVYDWKVYSTANKCQPPPLPKDRPQYKVSSNTNQADYNFQYVYNNSNNNSIYEPQVPKALSSIAEDSFLASDFMNKDDSFRLEEIMASAFDDIKRTLYEAPVEDPSKSKPSTPSSKPLFVSSSAASSLSVQPNQSASSSSSSSATTAQYSSVPSYFSPSVFSSPLREAIRSPRETKSTSKCPTALAISGVLTSVAVTSSSSSSSQVKSPPRPSPPSRVRSDAATKVLPATNCTSSTPGRKNTRSSSVPRATVVPTTSAEERAKIYWPPPLTSTPSVNPKPSTGNVTTSYRAGGFNSSFNFSLIKNELSKRHSVFNYNLNSVDNSSTSSTTTTSFPGNNNPGQNGNISRTNNLYSKPEKFAGSFFTGREPPKVQPAKVATKANPVVASVAMTAAATSSSATVVVTSSNTFPSSLSSTTTSLVSKALAAKLQASASHHKTTSSANQTLTSSQTSAPVITSSSVIVLTPPSSSSLPTLSSSSSSSQAVTKLSSKTVSPILSTSSTRRTKPSSVDLRAVAASNRVGVEATNSDPLGKMASVVALSALSTSNSKLREARAEIRKSSLELMSILPNASTKMTVEKTFSAPVTTSDGNNYVVS